MNARETARAARGRRPTMTNTRRATAQHAVAKSASAYEIAESERT
jgi:hypothetical protein